MHNFADIAHHILQPLEKMRRENDLVKIFPQYLTGEDLFGLSDPTVLKIIESVSESHSSLTSKAILFLNFCALLLLHNICKKLDCTAYMILFAVDCRLSD